MLKTGQTSFKNHAVWTPQDFSSMFGRFSTLWNKGLMSTIKALSFERIPIFAKFPNLYAGLGNEFASDKI